MKKIVMFILCASLVLSPVSRITYAAETAETVEETTKTRLEVLEEKEKTNDWQTIMDLYYYSINFRLL